MPEMQTIVTNVRGIYLTVCLSRGSSRLLCAKMAEHMLFGVNTPGGPWNIVLDVGPDPLTERGRGPLLTFGLSSYLRNS